MGTYLETGWLEMCLVKKRSSWSKVGLIQCDLCPHNKGGQTDTHRRTSGRVCSDSTINRAWREALDRPLPGTCRERGPARAFITLGSRTVREVSVVQAHLVHAAPGH